jgi:hypothetical protein
MPLSTPAGQAASQQPAKDNPATTPTCATMVQAAKNSMQPPATESAFATSIGKLALVLAPPRKTGTRGRASFFDV